MGEWLPARNRADPLVLTPVARFHVKAGALRLAALKAGGVLCPRSRRFFTEKGRNAGRTALYTTMGKAGSNVRLACERGHIALSRSGSEFFCVLAWLPQAQLPQMHWRAPVVAGGFLMRRNLIVLAVLLFALPVFASVPGPEILILSAPDAPGKISADRIATCLRLIAEDLKVDRQDLPRIVVMHVSRKTGVAAGVNHTTVRRNYDAHSDHTLYYEFWIVGEPTDVDYSVGAFNILENRLGQKVEEKQRLAIMQRALRFLQSTVSAYGE
jgi:hypothetical protein